MSKDLTGLGDLDIEEIDGHTRDELRQRNPDNQPEVILEIWTLAHLTQGDRVVRSVVYGIVTRCLTDRYLLGEIVCSPSLIDTPEHPGRRVYVTQRLRYECKCAGQEITIPESELSTRLLDPNEDIDDMKRRIEDGDR